jgi:hypothetical protein
MAVISIGKVEASLGQDDRSPISQKVSPLYSYTNGHRFLTPIHTISPSELFGGGDLTVKQGCRGTMSL